MAKVKYGLIVTDARKSSGGVTYSKNRYGNYIKSRAVPTQPRTELQLAARQLLQELSTRYRTLTDEEREGWNTLATQAERTDSLGGTYHPTGAQMFISVNSVRDIHGAAPVDVAPALGAIPIVKDPVVVAETADSVSVIYSAETGNAGFFNIYATAPRSAGSTFVTGFGANGLVRGGDFRLMAAVAVNPVGSTIDISAPYTARFGSLASKLGERVVVVVQPITAGYVMQPGTRIDTFVASS